MDVYDVDVEAGLVQDVEVDNVDVQELLVDDVELLEDDAEVDDVGVE